MSRVSTFADLAHPWADRGQPVLPLKPRAKVPNGRLARHGVLDASIDHDVIEAWSRAEPGGNLGLVTGLLFDALDFDGDPLDPDHALNRAMPLAERSEDDPVVKGPTVVTGGGGAQVYVATTGQGNRAGFVPGADWRGRGGYVVGAGSTHPNGMRYHFKLPNDPVYGPLAPIVPSPPWLLALLERPGPMASPVPIGRAKFGAAYGRRALESECGRIAIAPEGVRNDQLNRAAFALGSLVSAGLLDLDEVIDSMMTASLRAGLEEREARATLASGLKSGTAQPRVMA